MTPESPKPSNHPARDLEQTVPFLLIEGLNFVFEDTALPNERATEQYTSLPSITNIGKLPGDEDRINLDILYGKLEKAGIGHVIYELPEIIQELQADTDSLPNEPTISDEYIKQYLTKLSSAEPEKFLALEELYREAQKKQTEIDELNEKAKLS